MGTSCEIESLKILIESERVLGIVEQRMLTIRYWMLTKKKVYQGLPSLHKFLPPWSLDT